MTGLLCSPEEASCLIPNLIAELETPCPCEGLEGLVLCGLGYKGQRVTVIAPFSYITAKGGRIRSRPDRAGINT